MNAKKTIRYILNSIYYLSLMFILGITACNGDGALINLSQTPAANANETPTDDPDTDTEIDPSLSPTDSEGATNAPEPATLTSLSLNRDTVTLSRGQTTRFLATVELNDHDIYRRISGIYSIPGQDPEEIIWQSSDPEIVTIDSQGYAIGLSPGLAMISATTMEQNVFAVVTVLDPFPSSSDEIQLEAPEDTSLEEVADDSPSTDEPEEEEATGESEESAEEESEDETTETKEVEETDIDDTNDADTARIPEDPIFPETGFLNDNDLISYSLGDRGGYGETLFPTVLYGAPNKSLGNVLSLGFGGEITIELRDYVLIDGEGADFTVFENAFAGWIEPGIVSVSEDGENYFTFNCDIVSGTGCAGVTPINYSTDEATYFDATTSGGDTFDLADVGLTTARFIRIQDAAVCTSPMLCVAPTTGFDLDGLAILNGVNE